MSTISHNMHQHSTYAVVDTRSEKEKVWLILKRLDHPSFQTLKCMFLDALKGFHIDDLVCDVYERAKHERHSYCYCWDLRLEKLSKSLSKIMIAAEGIESKH